MGEGARLRINMGRGYFDIRNEMGLGSVLRHWGVNQQLTLDDI